VSLEFGAIYLSDASALSGFALSLEADGALLIGGSGSVVIPLPFWKSGYAVSGGPGVGVGAGAGGIVTVTSFRRTYTFDEASEFLPLGNYPE
jgi:hypothetical protein